MQCEQGLRIWDKVLERCPYFRKYLITLQHNRITEDSLECRKPGMPISTELRLLSSDKRTPGHRADASRSKMSQVSLLRILILYRWLTAKAFSAMQARH